MALEVYRAENEPGVGCTSVHLKAITQLIMAASTHLKLFFLCFRIVTMEFYGKNDLTLGIFLERYCFR